MLDQSFENFRKIKREEFDIPLSSLNLQEVKLFPKDTTINSALEYIRKERASMIAVGDSQVEGVISEDIFLREIGCSFEEKKNDSLESLMSPVLNSLSSDSTMLEAILLMGAKNIRHLIVNHEGRLCILLLKDLLKFAAVKFKDDLIDYNIIVDWAENGVYLQERPNFDEAEVSKSDLTTRIFETPLRKVMFNEASYCDISSSLADAARIMNQQSISSIVIMEYETEMKGVLTTTDLLYKGYGLLDFETTKASEVMTVAPHKLLEQEVLAVAIKNMANFNYRNVIICNQVGYPVSIVSILEVLRFICSKL